MGTDTACSGTLVPAGPFHPPPYSKKKRHSTERGQGPATGAGDPGGRLSFTSHSYGDPKQWAAFLGTPFLSGADGQLERVARIHKHPFYNLYTLDYDVALLELAGPVRRSRLVRPICLPEPAPRLPDGARCVITGWGSVREGGRRSRPSWGIGKDPTRSPTVVAGGRMALPSPALPLACRLDGQAAAEGGRAAAQRADLPPLLPGADQQPHAVCRLPAGRRGQLLGEHSATEPAPWATPSNPKPLIRAPPPVHFLKQATFGSVEFPLNPALVDTSREPGSTPLHPPPAR